MMRFAAFTTSLVLLAMAGLPAQDRWTKDEEELTRSAIARLNNFARIAVRNDVESRAKEAYELIIQVYDPEDDGALRAMGYTKKGGEWKEPEVEREWIDRADDEKRFEVLDDWKGFAERLAEKHRELGVQMLEDAPARAVHHLRMALYYNPFDAEAHEALGHARLDIDFGDGRGNVFYGTAEEVAFVSKLREIEEFAANLSKREYEIEPITELPMQFQRMVDEDPELQFSGAKSDTFTVFVRGTQENANDVIAWAERACDFLEFCLPDDVKKQVKVRQVFKRRGWVGFVWTTAERKSFHRLNPELPDKMNFVNTAWTENGKLNEVVRALTPVTMQDHMIAKVWKEAVGGNDAVNEGFMHAATWYLRGTAISRYGAESTATTTGARVELPDSANWWMRAVRDQAISSTDFPLNNLPRVQLSDFRNKARLKTWSFGVFALARFPQKWFHYVQKLPPSEERPFPEVIDKVFDEVMGESRAEVEDEWRGWAAGRTLASYATGYGPPILPEKPNKDQIKGLERINEFRAQLGLPPCEIDLEATLACRAHALFLKQNPDHWKWPEAHEEDPAKPGFTTRGMRAGLNSVIVIANDPSGHIDPADSLDGWMGTPYHRFPLIEANIKRIGFAAEGSVVVLDMGSLEPPRVIGGDEEPRKWIQWPAPGLTNVPTSFHAQEHPDPLGDTPEGKVAKPFELQQRAGYPISLQLERFVANQIDDAKMEVWSMKKRGKEYQRDEQVPLWVHTPRHPLLKRQENPSVVFGIPKADLEKNTVFEVVVTLELLAGKDEVKWMFKTGPQRRGHGRMKLDDDLAQERR